MGGALVRNEYDRANASTVRTSSMERGVGYNGVSHASYDVDIADDDENDDDENDDDDDGGRSCIDPSMARVSPRSARVSARTWSRSVVVVVVVVVVVFVVVPIIMLVAAAIARGGGWTKRRSVGEK